MMFCVVKKSDTDSSQCKSNNHDKVFTFQITLSQTEAGSIQTELLINDKKLSKR